MKAFASVKAIIKFFQDVAKDPRIPERDKIVLLSLIGLILSPVDIIPDWIPILGQLDDLLIIAIILDYFTRVLDQEVLLDHFPYSLKTFLSLKRFAVFIAFFAPGFLKSKIWKYTGNVYKK